MKIYEEVHTPFARACEHKLLSSIGKGVSKHKARQEAIEAGSKRKSSNLLHSDNTIDGYAEISTRYAKWMKEKHLDCTKLIVAHRRKYDHEYIQELIDSKTYSPATIKTYTAALAFLHSCTMDEVHDNRPVVHTKDATRNRNYTLEKYTSDLRYREKKGQTDVVDIMRLCWMTGMRKNEAEQVCPSNFHEENGRIVCHLSGNNNEKNVPEGERSVWTKGGRKRTIEILPKYYDELREILSRYLPDEKICPKTPGRIHVHGIRSFYACEMYQALARPIEEISKKERTMESGNWRSSRYVDADGYIWDRRALLQVSASMGHVRTSVIVESYLWRLKE